MKRLTALFCVLALSAALFTACQKKPATLNGSKSASTFYPASYLKAIQDNKSIKSVSDAIDAQVKDAEYYKKLTYDELWDMIIPPNIPRAHMVWSNGFCPSCKKPVAMYAWKTDPHNKPWKVECPYCKEQFPKNDFGAYYKSGLDDKGYFDIDKADKSLLYNTDHPDENDPLHNFGVDDGYGYKDDSGNTYWFAGYYMIKGQWVRNIMPAITGLAAAYVETGDTEYARRCGIILDRLADFFPEYNFKTQGIMYEGTQPTAGAFSYVVDNAGDVKSITLAYDKVFDAIKNDKGLVKFLKEKAKKTGLVKNTFADIQQNIETGIFQATLDTPENIASNYPLQPYCQFVIYSVLGKDKYEKEISKVTSDIIKKSTAVDGTTGEKGLAGYTLMDYRNFTDFFGLYIAADSSYLDKTLESNKDLMKAHQIFSNLIIDGFYPNNGDTGGPGGKQSYYANKVCGSSNVARLYWQMYKKTNDISYVQAIYQADPKNPIASFDLGTADLQGIGNEIDSVISQNGSDIKANDADFQKYKMAALHANTTNKHGIIFDYDSGAAHGHDDAMNIEFWAYGIDLMLDLGYPPVNYGNGWSSSQVTWYDNSGSHNTVSIIGNPAKFNNTGGKATTSLWVPAETLKGVGAAGSATSASVYSRYAFLTSIDSDDAYLFDIFQVKSTAPAVKNTSTNQSVLSTDAKLTDAPKIDTAWFAENTKKSSISTGFEARFKYDASLFPDKPDKANLYARYIELTKNADVYTFDKWFNLGDYNVKNPQYMPALSTSLKKSADNDYQGSFVSVLEPYFESSKLASASRLDVTDKNGKSTGESDVGAEVKLASGKTDVYMFIDSKDSLGTKGDTEDKETGLLAKYNIQFTGGFLFARFDETGKLERIVVSNAKSFKSKNVTVNFNDGCAYAEVEFINGSAEVISGDKNSMKDSSIS